MTTDTHEYGTVNGVKVQVLDRFRARPDCRVCGGAGWLDSVPNTDCPACHGTCKESKWQDYIKVGWLEGIEAGMSSIVLASAYHPEEVTPC